MSTQRPPRLRMSETLKTQKSRADWNQSQGVERMLIPFLRILYHGDLGRIGEVTAPELFFGEAQNIICGRSGPHFQDPCDPKSTRRPLTDPYISRHQFSMKWVAHKDGFEVSPGPGAGRRLQVVELSLGRGEPTLHEITEPTYLPPGTIVSVGRRLMLQLCLAPWRSSVHERMGLVGETERMWRLREDIASMAQFQRPALVLGETGSGKELVARALCQQSDRAKGPFMAINCAALPEHLVESELFGYTKGAFTGANTDKTGLFKAANGGTLFLDEFGELPLSIQAKMLRVLQDGLLTPLGSHQNISVDVRLIAATNRDPKTEIQAGRLRKDLYFRIATHVVRVPKLSERHTDIPLLFVAFLREIAREHHGLDWLWQNTSNPELPLPMSFFIEMMRYDWPGNVRELQNIVEQTARLNLHPGLFRPPEGLKDWTDSPEPIPARGRPQKAARAQTPMSSPTSERLNQAAQALGVATRTIGKLLNPGDLSRIEGTSGGHFDDYVMQLKIKLAQNLFDLLSAHNFNQRQVAPLLGVSRTTLGKLMTAFGLPRPQSLDLTTLENAWMEVGGKLDDMAKHLKVSPQGLRAHLTRQGYKRFLEE